MKLKALIFSLLCVSALCAEQRILPLESSVMNGCYMQTGVLKAHKTLPSQQGKNIINISPANAMGLFFQEDVFARKGGAKENELIQIKKSAFEYTPQKDADGSDYIDYCRKANFQFNVETAGKYRVYFRMRCPSKANWTFFFMFEGSKTAIHLQKLIPAPNVWFWAPGPEVTLDKRNYQFTIDSLLNGKRLGAIAFVPAGTPAPQGKLPYAENRKITSASMVFQNARPSGVQSFDKVLFDKVSDKGIVELFGSTDNGKTFKKIVNGDVKSFPLTQYGLTVKVEFKQDKNGNMPEIANIRLLYQFDPKAFAILANKTGTLAFTRKTGALSGIKLNKNNHFFQTEGIDKSMFELLLKQPGKKEKRYLSHKNAVLKSIRQEKNSIKINWTFPQEDIGVELNVTAGLKIFDMAFTIINNNKKWDVIEVEAPRLHELKSPAGTDDEILVWPFSAGEFLKAPALKGEQSVTYPDHAGLPFVMLTDGKCGFYAATHDKFLVTTHINSKANGGQNAIEVSFNRVHRIKGGEKRTYHFAIAPFEGSWHEGAKLYREFFYKNYPVNAYRPWLRNIDSWVQGSSLGHTGAVYGYNSYNYMQNDVKNASFLSIPYIQAWGCNMNGACPTYYLPRLDKGGEKLFAENIKAWRDKGGYIGHYYFGNGMAWYYSLSDHYFGIPWSKYPADVQPPSWDWFVKNKEYISDTIDINKDELMKKVAVITANQKKGKFISGGYGESYIPMNWRNGEYAAWLLKWIDRYISKYHCNTAYLDTFVFRNSHGDFNPFMKLNGEGDKPMFKMQFMNKMFKDMRAKEPDFCALTEGVADVFGTQLYFLISGFARNPSIFRYTIPDQIIFQGSCNGLWTRPLSEKSISEAFLLGNRFDWVIFFDSTYYILKLRQRVSPFLNLAVFDDVLGIESTVKNARIYAHRADDASEKFIANNGSRYAALTIENPDLVSGKVTYKAKFPVKYAMVCEYLKEPMPLKFTQNGDDVTFDMPQGKFSVVLLVNELKGNHAYTAVAEQTDTNTFEVRLTNFLDKKQNFTVKTLGKTYQVSAEPFATEILTVNREGKSDKFDVAQIFVESPYHKDMKVISVGKTGRKVPFYTVKRTTASDFTKLDFEEMSYSKKSPYSGKRSFELQGNGKFCMKGIPLKLEPEALYQIELKYKKGVNVSPRGDKCFLMVANYTPANKLERYLIFGGNTAADGKYHSIKYEFKTTKDLSNCQLFIYNHDSQDSVFIDDVELTKYLSLKKRTPENIKAEEKAAEAEKARKAAEKKAAAVKNAPKTYTVILEDNFDRPECKGIPYEGSGALLIQGNGEYKQHTFRLKLKKNQRYRVSFAIFKEFECSKVGHETMAAVCNYTKERKLERYILLAGSIKPDGKYHLAAGEFVTSENLHDCSLYFYNRNSTGKIYIDNLKIEEVNQ